MTLTALAGMVVHIGNSLLSDGSVLKIIGRISEAEPLVVTSNHLGSALVASSDFRACETYMIEGSSLSAAEDLARCLKQSHPLRLPVAIGGGRIIDITKSAAYSAGVPWIAVATSLSHDGICSPVAVLDD